MKQIGYGIVGPYKALRENKLQDHSLSSIECKYFFFPLFSFVSWKKLFQEIIIFLVTWDFLTNWYLLTLILLLQLLFYFIFTLAIQFQSANIYSHHDCSL